MKRIGFCSAALSFLIIMGVLDVSAKDEIRKERVQFKKGTTTATIKGHIKGYETVDYLLGAKAGQHMNVSLATKHGATYFNILAPGENEVAMFNASVSQNQYEGALPASGDYKIRVYMMRSAARRNEAASYTLTVGITGSPKPSDFGKAPASDAKVKGTPYHATGPLPCWMGNAPLGSSQCEFGVIRGKPGNADVHIKPAGGLERVLTFRGSTVTSGKDKIKAAKSGDMWTIEVNDYEHYQVSESVISGG